MRKNSPVAASLQAKDLMRLLARCWRSAVAEHTSF